MTRDKTAGTGRDSANPEPKRDPHPPGNTEKDASDWVSGGEPMTGAQASYLKALTEQAREPEAYDPELTKAEASRRIDALKAKLGLASDPPHTA
ncbi:MAG: DUF3072 domain-containing protein [Rhodoplanes sp.]